MPSIANAEADQIPCDGDEDEVGADALRAGIDQIHGRDVAGGQKDVQVGVDGEGNGPPVAALRVGGDEAVRAHQQDAQDHGRHERQRRNSGS